MGDTGDIGGQTPATAGDGRRLTYAQIADRLGISGEAARIMVRRRGWRRIIPNHPRGLTVVVVPDAALADEEGRRVAPTVADEPATTGDTLPGQAGQVAAGALAALETAVLSLTARAEAAERRADDAGARADRAEVRADMAERVAERARGEAREALQRAEAVEHARGRPEGEGPPTPRLGRLAGAIAMPAADDLRRVVRRAVWQPRAVLRGLWVRLRAAWREWSE